RGKGILLTNLRYKYEVRDDDAYFGDIKKVDIPEDMLDLATHIISKKKGHFDPEKFEDRYENALVAMLTAKQQGKTIEAPKPAKQSNVVNLMDALRRSIESEKGGKAAEEPEAAEAEEKPQRRPAAKSAKRGSPSKSAEKTTKKRAAG